MLTHLKRSLPLRIALKAGPLMLFSAQFLELDDEDSEKVIDNDSLTFGFGPAEPCDELDLRIPPWEDEDATS